MASTTLVVDADTVRERMSLQDLEDINTAIESGLLAAHLFFAPILGTPFEPVTATTDVFFLDSNLFTTLPNKMFRLRLKQAFVHAGSVSVKFAGLRVGALSAGAEAMPSADFYIDVEKGLVFIDANSYDQKFVVVTYSAGFDATHKAPEWLKQAVLAYMPSILLYQSMQAEPEKVSKQVLQIQNQASQMVTHKKRETALQLSPIY